MTTLWIALGGAFGSVARHHLGQWVLRRTDGSFPWGTLAINAIGSCALAALMMLALRSDAISAELRLALGVGVLGGFTTYSTFNFETFAMLERGAWGIAASYVVATVIGCMIAGALGWFGAGVVVGPR
jgi:fluoride exporter